MSNAWGCETELERWEFIPVIGLETLIRARVFYPYGKFGRMLCYRKAEAEHLDTEIFKRE